MLLIIKAVLCNKVNQITVTKSFDKSNRDIRGVITEHDQFVEYYRTNPGSIEQYYEARGRRMGLQPSIARTLKKFGVIYPVLNLDLSEDEVVGDSIMQNFYLYQRFYSQIRRQWEAVVSRGSPADQEEFRSLFGHFRSDQDFLRIMGYNEGALKDASYKEAEEAYLIQYKAIGKRIKDSGIGNETDKEFNPAFWDKVFTRFQYGANGLKLEDGRVYAIAAHGNVEAIEVMLGDNSQYRRTGKYDSCTPIYSAGVRRGLSQKYHAPFLYGTFNKEGDTLGVVYDPKSIDVVSGDTQALASYGREPKMTPKVEVVPSTKDSNKIGEFRGGIVLTDITRYNTIEKEMVTGISERLNAPDAIELAVSNVWRRANISPYLDPRNMSEAKYLRRLAFNQRYPDATNRGKDLYQGQDKYAELLISHKGSMRNSIDGIFIDITGVSNDQIKSKKVKDILSLMANYPFLKFYIYDRNNARGNVMKSYSSLVARDALGSLPHLYGEHSKLSDLLDSLDKLAQKEVNEKAKIILEIQSRRAIDMPEVIVKRRSNGDYGVKDEKMLDLFSPNATSEVELDIEKAYGISQAVFCESRYQRLVGRFKKGQKMVSRIVEEGAGPIKKNKMEGWLFGALMSCCMVKDNRDEHRALTVAIKNMNYAAKDKSSLFNCMNGLVESFNEIFVPEAGRSYENLEKNLLQMADRAIHVVRTFEKKPIIDIFKELFPAEYSPESSFSARLRDFMQRAELDTHDLQQLFESNADLIDSYINQKNYSKFVYFMSRDIETKGSNDGRAVATLFQRWGSEVVEYSQRSFIGMIAEATTQLENKDVGSVKRVLLGFMTQIEQYFPAIHELHKEQYMEEVSFLDLLEPSSVITLHEFFDKKVREFSAGNFNSEVIVNFIDDLLQEVEVVRMAEILGSVDDFGGAAASQSGAKTQAIDRAIDDITDILRDSPIVSKNERVKCRGTSKSLINGFSITKIGQGCYEVDISGFKFELRRGKTASAHTPFQVQDHAEFNMEQLNQYLSDIESSVDIGGSQKVVAAATSTLGPIRTSPSGGGAAAASVGDPYAADLPPKLVSRSSPPRPVKQVASSPEATTASARSGKEQEPAKRITRKLPTVPVPVSSAAIYASTGGPVGSASFPSGGLGGGSRVSPAAASVGTMRQNSGSERRTLPPKPQPRVKVLVPSAPNAAPRVRGAVKLTQGGLQVTSTI